MSERLRVNKTYKLAIGGAFPRSESGRTFEVLAADGSFLANAALASRKDVRDAVVAARAAQPGWAAATAFNRSQVLYRVAEVLEGRREQFAEEITASTGVDHATARAEVEATVERWVWYAGWADKYVQVVGSVNPVAGPYFNLSAPVPVGVVGVVAPQRSALLGLVSVVAPVLVSGCTAVVVASGRYPLSAITLAEVLTTSDVPGGVVNVLTGSPSELAPVLAGHLDVDGLDLTGATDTDLDVAALERLAAEDVTRVRTAPSAEPDWTAVPRSISRITDWTDLRTVWHPKGR
jgi:acyl-CoA reductase-like NAD-dependent aldehyde dehydrogenase